MNLLITICARGGSKGVPNKNIVNVGGKPLIAHTINTAIKFSNFMKNEHTVHISLSSDSNEIIQLSNQFGLHTKYQRPEILATDKAGKIDVIKHLLLYEENEQSKTFDIILDLDVTSPLRTIEDLNQAFGKFSENLEAYNLFSVNHASKNPYFNMVEFGEFPYIEQCKKPDYDLYSRQSAPQVFELNASFYFYRRKFFEQQFRNVYTDKSMIYVMDHVCFDVDTISELEYLNYLMSNNKLEFTI